MATYLFATKSDKPQQLQSSEEHMTQKEKDSL